MADVPVGAFLSGGIDSSVVCAIYQRHASDKVRTFSIAFEEAGFNEADFARQVQLALGREPLLVEGEGLVRRVGWCTGGGQGYIDQAIAAGVDLYLTGEASEQTFHSARENGIGFIAAGHHATERYGVQALGDYLARRFALEHLFIDCPNPI